MTCCAAARARRVNPSEVCAAHAERVPRRQALEGVILLQEHDEHLIGSGRIRSAPRRGDDAIRLHPHRR